MIVISLLLSTAGLIAMRPTEALAQASPAQVQPQGNEGGSLELVDPDVFRACGDPRNLPFSNDKSEGSARSSATPIFRRPPASSA